MQQHAPRISEPPGLTTLDSEPNAFWYGAWKNVNIVVWAQAATREAVERLDRFIPERAEAHPERLSTVHIATPTAGVPNADARAAFADTAKRWPHNTGCVAVVLEHKGFAASAMRSAVTGIQLLASIGFPLRSHRSLEEAVPWLVEMHTKTTRVELDPGELRLVLQSARSRCG
jgi:hypothetical protein